MSGRASHSITVQVDIPPSLSPDRVIEALHFHLNVATLQPLVQNVKMIPPSQVEGTYFGRAEEEFFNARPDDLDHYEVTERITVVPGIGDWGKKDITFPARFQNTVNGIKSWADAPSGVTVHADWIVKPQEGKRGQWVLEEQATVECAPLLMPFVRKTFVGAHSDICQRLLEKIIAQGGNEGVQELPG